MTKIIIFILACNTCNLERITFKKDKELHCSEQGDLIVRSISKYYPQKENFEQGWYTKQGKLVIGFRCE